MLKKTHKCYIYTRVSTAIQVDSYSFEAQKDKLRKHAEYQDYVIAREYSDEGFSGKNIQGRLDFQRMLQDIVFSFPVPIQGHEVKELPLEKSTLIETLVLLSHGL